ncbi:hypothetical protein ACS15_1263 [Ralstonia insidiosa]|uniref:Uncharacterized protein n=1 Tax=Ralstonia insidiosa TaxID=190721 RepID=A0AAC9BI47_9RALS|nr:hypothetical protein ACS15_1263 [Ralstonia insidiosa]
MSPMHSPLLENDDGGMPLACQQPQAPWIRLQDAGDQTPY